MPAPNESSAESGGGASPSLMAMSHLASHPYFQPASEACPRIDAWELLLVRQSQTRLAKLDGFLEQYTDAVNPSYLVVLVIPVLFAVHAIGAMRKPKPTHDAVSYTALCYQCLAPLLITLTADWLNASVKLPLQGDRPFWCATDVRQFRMTCESSFGMPSGHCMVFTAFLFDAVSGTMCLVPLRWRRGTRSLTLLQVAAAVAIVITAVSRVHTGSHFPSQTIYGTLCGVLLAWVLRTFTTDPMKDMSKMRPSVVLCGALVVAVIAAVAPVMAIASMEERGLDTLRSIQLATTACNDASQMHRTTPPVVSLCRAAATAIGALVGATMVAKVVPATLPAAIATPRKGTALIGALVAVAAYAIFQSPIASAGGAPGWRGGVEAASRAFATHVLAFGVAPTLASIAVHGGITNRVALKCR